MHSLLKAIKSILLSGGAATATSAVESAVVDCANFENVQFEVVVGTSHAGNSIKVQQGDASDLSDATDITGATVSYDGTDLMAIVEVVKPRKRYARVVVTRTGATTTIQSIVARLSHPRTVPVSQDASVQAVSVVSPE